MKETLVNGQSYGLISIFKDCSVKIITVDYIIYQRNFVFINFGRVYGELFCILVVGKLATNHLDQAKIIRLNLKMVGFFEKKFKEK